MMDNSPYAISLKEIHRHTKRIKRKNLGKGISPLSGSEPPYEPSKWNNRENIRQNHNCYSYVLNTIAGGREGKPQPGYFSGFGPLTDKDYNCETFYQRLRKDIPSMYLTTFDQECHPGFYKGFIALDPKKEDQDYHFYRQDDSGMWSHKPGRTDAVNYDADNKKITNPLKANRNYTHFNYSVPCFFFCLNPKLSRSRSHSRQSTRNYFNYN